MENLTRIEGIQKIKDGYFIPSTLELGENPREFIDLINHIRGMLGKVEGYNKSVQTMSSEMKALSKVMEKIIEPLSTNVKELSRITEKFKGIKG